MFSCLHDIFIMACCVSYTPDIMGHMSSTYQFTTLSLKCKVCFGFGKCNTSHHLPLSKQWILTCSSPVNASILHSLSLLWYWWMLTLSVACCSIWLLCDFLDESLMHFWGNFVRLVTFVKIYHWSKFVPFGDNGPHCGLLETQCLCNPFHPFNHGISVLVDL